MNASDITNLLLPQMDCEKNLILSEGALQNRSFLL